MYFNLLICYRFWLQVAKANHSYPPGQDHIFIGYCVRYPVGGQAVNIPPLNKIVS